MARSLTVISLLLQSTTHCHYRVYTKFLLTYIAIYRGNRKVLPLGITALQPQSHFHLGTPYTQCCIYSVGIPDDGQQICPKYVEFFIKNKFEKQCILLAFVIGILLCSFTQVMCISDGKGEALFLFDFCLMYSAFMLTVFILEYSVLILFHQVL